jgi:deoxyribodipyrimidine photolyase
MASRTIEEGRTQRLNTREARGGDYILYWMQQSQRAVFNPALEYAIQRANEAKLPLLVGFGLMDGYPEANIRHYRFMLEGLQETQRTLARRRIPLVVQHGNPDLVALKLARHAALVVAMREMRYTGYLHNALRMYWGKKILEWSSTPEHGYRVALALNNTYLLDGRDASSYANIGWVFGLHDRPWGQREIFGTIRYMSAGGLERKADMEAYLQKVDALVAEAQAAGVRFVGD